MTARMSIDDDCDYDNGNDNDYDDDNDDDKVGDNDYDNDDDYDDDNDDDYDYDQEDTDLSSGLGWPDPTLTGENQPVEIFVRNVV